jgi:hypothetical protein
MSVALKDAVEFMQSELRANPDNAVATFAANSRQVQGLQSETKIRNFTQTFAHALYARARLTMAPVPRPAPFL